ncbi:MAG: hypothetical protein U5P41_15510 [Gammaproteobacteria bacterium]|nr:hypothetical protein [Gammaproteobacteria bacterium]
MNTLLDISNRIDERSLIVYEAIDNVAKVLGIPYMVVGASARDLVLHYGFNARIKRATADIDVGIQVNNWEEFLVFKTASDRKRLCRNQCESCINQPRCNEG